jgi:hypothetical protein
MYSPAPMWELFFKPPGEHQVYAGMEVNFPTNLKET